MIALMRLQRWRETDAITTSTLRTEFEKMQTRQHLRSQIVFLEILFMLWAGRVLGGPANKHRASSSRPSADGPQAVIRANYFVDDDNVGAQDGTAFHPYQTVQQAIDAAKDEAVIAVAEGNYPQNVQVQVKAVRVYGGYVGGTVASYAAGTAGNFSGRNPASNPSHLQGNGEDSVVTVYNSGASIVDGFLITGGERNARAIPSWVGGGFYVYQGSPTISNNVIEKKSKHVPRLAR